MESLSKRRWNWKRKYIFKKYYHSNKLRYIIDVEIYKFNEYDYSNEFKYKYKTWKRRMDNKIRRRKNRMILCNMKDNFMDKGKIIY